MRTALAAAEVPQPAFAAFTDPDDVPDVGYPCVVKPVGLSGSRGVIRADDQATAVAAAHRAHDIAGGGALLVEEYLPGDEVAVEGLLRDGTLDVLAVFDKPDPLVGPYFEETMFVTPSRLPKAALAEVARVTQEAASALGLAEGPIHAELRVDGGKASVIEVAARSIGGLCARALRFGAGISLEEVILRHALGRGLDGLVREDGASGVMMIPIPRAGVLNGVNGRDAALAVAGVVGLEITIPVTRRVEPLPEGDRYLGFIFARGQRPNRSRHRCARPTRRWKSTSRQPRRVCVDGGDLLMRVALVACYELGHQPLHVAAPAAKLRERGHEVRCLDLSVQPWDPELVTWAERMAFSVPMHTATRIARRGIEAVRASRGDLPVACYGLYAGTTADAADCAIAGEADDALIAWVEGRDPVGVVHLGREAAQGGQPLPARDLLPPLDGYARLARDGR